ncbi:MAG: U32 family peptidase [Kiritimatiellae bacterium]|nr:U32 family peptidase [Kiritimatiellia bacterium]
MNQAELLSPAGDFETALAAFDAGADAVYCGLPDFSARAFAKNLDFASLSSLVRLARKRGRKVYVTFNTVLDEDALEEAARELSKLADIGPDGIIVQDLGVARLCRRHFTELNLHASTQLVAHNLEGVLALGELGFTRVVLARELSLAEIASIAKRCGGIELECFIHGALCYSLSGLCLFGAMEKGRSGNRGKCPYCCRMAHPAPGAPRAAGNEHLFYPFSMKDLRLGEDARKLVEAGVASLKIEGRMKSSLYVASVTRHYREILDGSKRTVANSDLETVFSRRTTELYFNGSDSPSPIDSDSLGHLGTPVGTVKRVTRDREGRCWLRFHTARALEVHDGLQFDSMADGRHLGLGIREMRQAISRTPVFEVSAGTDVEIEVPEDFPVKTGERVYCSMSNAVKRMFPAPAYRPSDYPGTKTLDVRVTIAPEEISAAAKCGAIEVEASVRGTFAAAKSPEKTYSAVEKAFSKLGETDYSLGSLKLVDTDRLFAPMGVLNDLRRDLVEKLDDARARSVADRAEKALSDDASTSAANAPRRRTVKVRPDQKVPSGEWDEVIVAVSEGSDDIRHSTAAATFDISAIRLAMPVYTHESDLNKLRVMVKHLRREGFEKWEASDLATLKILKAAGIADITADWTLYAFNSQSLAAIAELGVKRFVASPENTRENLQYLAESGYDVEFLSQQSTPLFVSLTKPGDQSELAVFERDGLWVTTKRVPRTFDLPEGVSTRIDLSWDPVAP